MNGTLTDVLGIEVGHYTDGAHRTGCTVVLTRDGAIGGVDVRGGAPGTRETDLLKPGTSAELAHGIALSGGSAYGLATATGVMRYLEEQGVGHRVGAFIVPIVPAAILFDLAGSGGVRPGEDEGYRAAASASTDAVAQGSVGAGTGATVGKALGRAHAMKGGLGSASIDLGGGAVLAALVAVNAIGGVVDPATGAVLAGPRDADGRPRDSVEIYASPDYGRAQPMSAATEPLGNTTIGVVATSVRLDRAQANRLASVAQDGIALAVRPAHLLHDGDTLFALSTLAVDAPDEVQRLYALAPTVVANAIAAAVRNATGTREHPAVSELEGGA